MKRSHRHLRTGLTNGLGGNNTDCLAGLNPGGLVLLDHAIKDQLELGIGDLFFG